jgi:hypothetical protein
MIMEAQLGLELLGITALALSVHAPWAMIESKVGVAAF